MSIKQTAGGGRNFVRSGNVMMKVSSETPVTIEKFGVKRNMLRSLFGMRQVDYTKRELIAIDSAITDQKELARQGNSLNGTVIPKPRDMTYMEHLEEKQKVESAIDESLICGKIPNTPLFCTPNCQHNHNHNHNFQYDFSKNFKDPRSERPGVEFLENVKHMPMSDLDMTSNQVGELGRL
jgi:hypothetical protein